MTEHQFRERILPLGTEDVRPLWSVMIPTYHCAGYLRSTLESVLAQDPGVEQMQIEVVDDHSTSDDPEAVVREFAGDRVAFYRQPQNVGHVRNFTTCLQRSRGRLVHLLHGDDAVLPGFYAALARPLLAHPELGAAFCRHVYVDERGSWQAISRLHRNEAGPLEDAGFRIAAGLSVQPPAMVVRRAVYERLGSFDARLRVAGEDWEMWTRIASHYPVWYEPEPLALYIRRPGSLISASVRSGAAISDCRVAIELAAESLPEQRKAAALAGARRRISSWALDQATALIVAGDRRAAMAQIREAVRTDPSMRGLLRTGARIGQATLRHVLRRSS